MYRESNFRAKIRIFIILITAALLLIPLVGIILFVVQIEDMVYADGEIIPEDSYEIVGHVDARVVRLNHRTGDTVKKGDIIAELDSTIYENEALAVSSAIKELKAELDVKKSELEILEKEPLPKELWHSGTDLKEAEEKASRAREKLERYRKLIESNAISKFDFDKVELEYIQLEAALQRSRDNAERVKAGLAAKNIEKARNDIALVQARLEGKRATLERHNRQIADCRLTAPADGRIIDLPCKNTYYVERGKVALTIAGGADLMVLAKVDERFVRKIRLGQKARVSSEIFSRMQYGSFEAVVEKIGYIPLPDEGRGVKYPVKLRLYTDGCDLKFGSKSEVAIVTGKQPAIYALLNITEEDFQKRPMARRPVNP